ncbi:PEP-CTERM sorting domain-containing protein [Methyloversatilis sp.]|uniref:PEP-CTERM sorting domain-containing protein n=1 Tax=Methyloversatilis sp. TaxID=2569862 RepID=UPI00273659A0|nr:PEP-CTERM sorting domain-containing protein [Methyloversatilis sp.]MDP2869606.1 PEP-CTERM sorting domain-containing protein [Methyloversatilis sp.]MDP3289025.1 PEP-CTERM sorting domain-containing protein [Methyloversatilis sp.]MDP3456972.1 PEP-CTERM sorting domain-containing protein [Methyloversatilis sp.]MDP3579934.1 PEP-CTERM sorting domain-containing protein [Methyloversatilis sp.]
MASRRPSLHMTGLLIALAALPLSAGAATLVQRGPDSAPGTVQTVLGTGLQSLNLDGTPFVSARGVSIVSKSQANDGDGVIRVFSEIDSRGVSGIPDALIGNAFGQVQATAAVVGEGDGGAVDVTFVFNFDGAFHTYSGNVFHLLGATLTVALPSSTVAFTNVEYAAAMDFRTDLLDAEAVNVSGSTVKRYFEPGFVQVVEDFDGASYTVDSQEMADVAGELRLTMSLLPGQSFQLIANLFTQVSPEPLIPVSGALDYSQSWGAVDGFNTGTLSILLPQGYALSGDAGLLTNPAVAAPIPEPGTWAMLLAGLMTLWGTGAWRTRSRRASCPDPR